MWAPIYLYTLYTCNLYKHEHFSSPLLAEAKGKKKRLDGQDLETVICTIIVALRML